MKRRILIVDDEEELRDLLSTELEAAGYAVVTAANGQSAVDQARHAHFDLAVTDLRMPVMDGVATVRALRAIDPTLPVLIATGYAPDETEDDWEEIGVVGIVRKPFSVDELLDAIARALPRA